jgi:quinol monooxygenase YgiN
LCRSRDDRDIYYAVEQYQDEAAMKLHVSNWQSRGDVPDVLAEPPSIKIHDTVPKDNE